MRLFDGTANSMVVGVGDGQGSLVFYSPWSHKKLDTTEQLNNNNNEFPGNASAAGQRYVLKNAGSWESIFSTLA